MSPFVTKESMEKVIDRIYEVKKEYDSVKDVFIPYEVPHKPRQFVLR